MRTHVLHWLSACGVLVAGLGCGDDAAVPVSPTSEAAVASAASASLRFRQVTVQCGVGIDHRAYCWGDNNVGQLGNGTTESSASPVVVVGGLQFRSLSTGSSFTCGVTPDDVAYCWGHNQFGKLGNGTIEVDECLGGIPCSTRPLRVAGGLRFTQVSAGQHHACGVTTHGRAYCWGWNGFGQLGDGTTNDHLTPAPVAGPLRFTYVSTGNYHTCAVTTESRGYCWGENSYGQLGALIAGRNWQRARSRPTAVAGKLEFRVVNAGYFDTCGVTIRDQAYCWGDNSFGKLGNGQPNDDFKRTPSPVAGGLVFRDVDPYYLQTCGVTTSKEAYCWGVIDSNNGPDSYTLTPVPVEGGLHFRQLDEGGRGACGTTTQSLAYCWSGNLTPEPVPAPE